jgi:3-oxoacyl-[acyl-carrier-protein] synthase-3
MTVVPKKKDILAEKYEDIFGKDVVEDFSKKVGIVERRISEQEQTASDLAFVAARNLLERKKIDKSEIGILIFVTETPDYRIPATACILHKRLELEKDCIAFDVNLGCSGYVYGFQIVASLLEATGEKYGLLLVGDTLNKAIAPEDRSSAMLFGDGGSATLLKREENAGIIHTACRTDGSGFKSIIIPAGCYRNRGADSERRLWSDGNKRSEYDVYLNGVDVFSFAITEVPAIINEFFDIHNGVKENYDSYILHQANCYILKQIAKRSKLPEKKVPVSLDRYGNTTATSIPLTICDKYGEAKGQKSLSIFTCGFGVGQSWGIVDFEIKQDDIYPIIETNEHYEDGGVSHD